MNPTGDEIGARMARQTLNTAAVKADCVYCGDREFIAKMRKTETGHLCHACAAAGKAPVIVEKPAEITKPENAMKKIRTFVCTYCGKPISKGNMTKLAGKWACRDCERGKTVHAEKQIKAVLRVTDNYVNIDHPKHYTQKAGVECIQVTEQFNFNRGNAIKYIWRAGDKDPSREIEDLKKGRWYLDREIKRMEDGE